MEAREKEKFFHPSPLAGSTGRHSDDGGRCAGADPSWFSGRGRPFPASGSGWWAREDGSETDGRARGR